jgi:hypothetical protein
MGFIFSYYAKDKNGEGRDGTIEAINQDDAINKLEIQGLCVVSIEMVVEKKSEARNNRQPAKLPLSSWSKTNPPLNILFIVVCVGIPMFLLHQAGCFAKKPPRQPTSTSKSSSATLQAQEDIELAKLVYETGKALGLVGLIRVEVSESVMIVNVNMDLYREMYGDKIYGNQLMRSWQKLLAKVYDKRNGIVGVVMLYANGQKVAECDASMWGEVNVKWLDN